MDNPRQPEVPLELFEQLFPWPEEVPLPRPRFGKVTRQDSARLPEPVARHDERGPRPPFCLVWESQDLGLTVRVEEEVGEHAGQLSVTARSNHPEHLGKQVKVVLISKAAGQQERRQLVAVPLDAPRLDPVHRDSAAPTGCYGRVLLGTAADLRAWLGDTLTLDAFLLT